MHATDLPMHQTELESKLAAALAAALVGRGDRRLLHRKAAKIWQQ